MMKTFEEISIDLRYAASLACCRCTSVIIGPHGDHKLHQGCGLVLIPIQTHIAGCSMTKAQTGKRQKKLAFSNKLWLDFICQLI